MVKWLIIAENFRRHIDATLPAFEFKWAKMNEAIPWNLYIGTREGFVCLGKEVGDKLLISWKNIITAFYPRKILVSIYLQDFFLQ